VTIAIFVPKWARGERLDEGVSISMMAMVFYIFISINMMTYVAMNAVQTFLAIVERMSSVYAMEEYTDLRNIDVAPD
jgi:hypothetical protein